MKPILILVLLAVCASCTSQHTSLVTDKSTSAFAVKGDTVTELARNIMIVYQDKKNHYWFGSWEEGLYRYDGKTILHFTTKHGLSANRIDEIKEDNFGNMYFNTSNGVDKFDGENFTAVPIVNNIDEEWKLEPDDIWFKCTREFAHVYRYDGTVLHALTFPENELEKKYYTMFPNTPISPYLVYCVYKDSRGNIWFGTGALGACRYDGKSIDWIQENDVTELHNGPANGVRSIIEDKEGYFWFNTMYRYGIYGQTNFPLSNQNPQKFNYLREKGIGSLDENKTGNLTEYLSIAKDNHNELWITTYKDGVWHYDGKKITHYVVKDGLKDITLFSIYKDNYGNLWLGTHESGAYKFNGKVFEKFSP